MFILSLSCQTWHLDKGITIINNGWGDHWDPGRLSEYWKWNENGWTGFFCNPIALWPNRRQSNRPCCLLCLRWGTRSQKTSRNTLNKINEKDRLPVERCRKSFRKKMEEYNSTPFLHILASCAPHSSMIAPVCWTRLGKFQESQHKSSTLSFSPLKSGSQMGRATHLWSKMGRLGWKSHLPAILIAICQQFSKASQLLLSLGKGDVWSIATFSLQAACRLDVWLVSPN